ncbi:SDR family NAD(P)-dependent oxidoreductase [Eisenibacter elegans]|jgi:short-subunit dehydrogenase|uniref:SDR family NAD(P)-dependent oxidoreductase n=1 Tax=Eisenibacter elegans TaxID=997 RepID=UPI0004154E92|nr:SDR family oxidoreductase [Eisenibacter elegans]
MHPLIIITGATKGLGKAIGEVFAQNQFDVLICARNQADLDQTITQWQIQYPGQQFYGLVADFAQASSVQTFAREVQALQRPIEVLVNNAGFFSPGSILEEPDGALEQMLQVNLLSAYQLTRALAPSMIARKQGHIFNMCSIASFMAYPNGGSYSITKFALYGMSKVLREELKPHHIRVTSLLPGAAYTASWEGVDLPQERFMKAEDVAQTVWAAYSLSNQTVVEEIILRPQLGDI